MENKIDIGKIFKDKLDNIQKSPNEDVWNSINAHLQTRKKNKFLGYIPTKSLIIILSLFITCLLISIWHYKLSNSGSNSTFPSDAQNITLQNDTKNKNLNSTDETATAKPSYSNDSINSQNSASKNNSKSGKHNHDRSLSKTNSKNLKNNKKQPITFIPHSTITTYPNTENKTKNKKIRPKKMDHNNNEKIKSKKLEKATTKSDKIGQKRSNTNRILNTNRNKRVSVKQSLSYNNEKKKIKRKNTPSNILIPSPERRSSYKGSDDSYILTEKDIFGENKDIIFSQRADESKSSNDSIISLRINQHNDTATIDNDSISIIAVKDSIVITETKKDSIPSKKMDTIFGREEKQFYIYPNLSGVSYYDYQSASLSIDDTQAKITSKTAVSYGVYLGYNISKKISLRTGINIRSIELSTSRILAAERLIHLPANYIETLAYPDNFQNVDYKKGQSNRSIFRSLGNPETLSTEIDIDSKFKYIEIPLEGTYNIISRRFGLSLNGGVSTLLLIDNKIYARNGKGSIHMGSNKNAQDVSFSANFGLGLHYNLTKSLRINIEPGIRYYLNTFKDANPFSLNVAAGIQYNFSFSKKEDVEK